VRQPDERLLDIALRAAEAAALLADENFLRGRGRQGENLRRDQIVVHHGVGLREKAECLAREQFRVTRSGANQIDDTTHGKTNRAA
jgi:hypothetical protein